MKRSWTVFRYTTAPDASTELFPFTKTIEYNYYNSNNNLTYKYVHIYTDNEKILEILLEKDIFTVKLHLNSKNKAYNKADKKDILLKTLEIKNTLELETSCKEKMVGVKWKDNKEHKIQLTFYVKEEADEFLNEFNKILSKFYKNQIFVKNIKKFLEKLGKNNKVKINIEKYRTDKTFDDLKKGFLNIIESIKSKRER